MVMENVKVCNLCVRRKDAVKGLWDTLLIV